VTLCKEANCTVLYDDMIWTVGNEVFVQNLDLKLYCKDITWKM
jgi:hypothetical protein